MANWAKRPERRAGPRCPPMKSPRLNRKLFAAVTLLAFLGPSRPALADEFDVLVAIRGAAPINDRWQACAASYVRPRIESRQPSTKVVGDALRKCRVEEGRMRRFLAGKIGARSAGTVIRQLREKYHSDLITVIDARRNGD
ncbi:hypothetical protein KHP60_16065 [Microvirga sp. 3-52]|uniref:hypothetical protein n=1 Tax=Microvirga sp. 3-52 TaxID=2792425 RepID=UPI001AC1D253|nr:hypothetical protein [Microvirga sp. 3-52]MBO1906554.1 hypothetical protein [Microvirga sp. 3-52]MBS7453847.1 hypothetical protein [Microvirga sp. 3-52]